MKEYYYRFNDEDMDSWISKHAVIERTPCGVWLDYHGQRKFVLSGARKRFACPTIEEAKESFIARKTRQLAILRARVLRVESLLRGVSMAVRRFTSVEGGLVDLRRVNR